MIYYQILLIFFYIKYVYILSLFVTLVNLIFFTFDYTNFKNLLVLFHLFIPHTADATITNGV